MRWFTSDLHIGDPWAAKLRYNGIGHDAVFKHDNWLASRWDKNIGDDDVVFILGDLIAGVHAQQNLSYVRTWLRDRPGSKVLIVGNQDEDAHDHPGEVLGVDHYFDELSERLTDGAWVRMSHYPTTAFNQDEVLLHGHTHQRVRYSHLGNRLRVHVGWDAWRRFIPEQDLVDYISTHRVKPNPDYEQARLFE